MLHPVRRVPLQVARQGQVHADPPFPVFAELGPRHRLFNLRDVIMAHGPETDLLSERAKASLRGQDWVNEHLSGDDISAVEMTVMFLVALAAKDDPGFLAAVEAFRR